MGGEFKSNSSRKRAFKISRVQHRIARIVPLYWLLTTIKLIFVFLFADLALRSNLDLGYVVRSYLFFPLVNGAGHFRPSLPVGWTLTYKFLF
jgi:exopolysaccharide production protein ExoZ